MAKSPIDLIMEISQGFTLSRTLHVVAELGISDKLDEAPRNATELAAATSTDPEALYRALRLLAAYGIFKLSDGAWTHTPASLLLRSDHPQSMRSFVRMFEIPRYGISAPTSITRFARAVPPPRRRCRTEASGATSPITLNTAVSSTAP